jgi:hypothetical protein
MNSFLGESETGVQALVHQCAPRKTELSKDLKLEISYFPYSLFFSALWFTPFFVLS